MSTPRQDDHMLKWNRGQTTAGLSHKKVARTIVDARAKRAFQDGADPIPTLADLTGTVLHSRCTVGTRVGAVRFAFLDERRTV